MAASALRSHFESNLPGRCIQSENEIAVASDAFNGTLLTPLWLLYEYPLSLLFSLDHNRHLLVGNCVGAKPVRHGESVRGRTEQDAANAFSDHE